MLLMGDLRLDLSTRWVALPDVLGGGRADVIDYQTLPCPCGHHDTLHLALNTVGPNGKPLRILECSVHNKFLFVEGKEETK